MHIYAQVDLDSFWLDYNEYVHIAVLMSCIYDLKPKIAFHVKRKKMCVSFVYFIVEQEITHYGSPMSVIYSIFNETIFPYRNSSPLTQC